MLLEDLGSLALLGLNVGLVVGGMAVQVPQILKIWLSGSTSGLSELSWTVQLFSTSLYVCYNFLSSAPFLTYGDAFFASLSYLIIVLFIWRYNPGINNPRRRLSLSLFCILIVCVWFRRVHPWVQYAMGVVPMPMLVAARVPQIQLIMENRSLGNLSVLSIGLMAMGNAARIITTLFMVKDTLILASHTTAFILTVTPLIQAMYYTQHNKKVV